MSNLIIDQVSMRFELPSGDSVQALLDNNLEIMAGEIMAVLGPSGCGKTTLLNVTGARVAMGVCWGTVVAAELVAAERGAGMMIMVASRFQLTDIVIMGIILTGVIGFGIDILMRVTERWLIPWKGRG